jgi:hypothetical protein
VRTSLLALILCACPVAAQTPVKLNQIQVLGSHNSYHAGLAPTQMRLLREAKPDAADALEYSHPPLNQQLDAGVRQLELDVFEDPQGGLFAKPAGLEKVKSSGLAQDPPFDPEGALLKPGFKVLHHQAVDYRSTCQPFIQCLTVVHDWSVAHPQHLPVFIIVENKDVETATGKVPFTKALFDALDAEILSVFPRKELVTPDDVRGSYKTLREAVRKGGWPSLDAARGKVIFLLDQRRVEPLYTAGHPSLEGRVLFTNAAPGKPDAAFTEVNEAMKQPGLIAKLVRQGYMVRTRTDEPTAQARTNDIKERTAALASGAQILSTDYPFGEKSKWTGYSVTFPGDVTARCNPVTGGANCSQDALSEKP